MLESVPFMDPDSVRGFEVPGTSAAFGPVTAYGMPTALGAKGIGFGRFRIAI